MSQPFKLYRLQQTDSQLDQVNTRLQAIEAALNENKALRQAQERLEKAGQALEKERKALRQSEQTVKDQRVKIEQSEAALYGGKVRNPKELQDLQNEAAALKRYLSKLEDRQLEAMFAVEEAEAALNDADERLKEIQQQLREQHRDLNEEQAHLMNERERLKSERNATISTIPEADLRLYETLRKQRRGVAVAMVTDKACSACGSTLNAALLQAARSPNQITRCDTCGRILYSG